MPLSPRSHGDRPHPQPKAIALAGAVAGLSALLTLLVVAFAWPVSNTEPRDVPLAVAGPSEATAVITERLAQERPGAFEMSEALDRAAAVRMIEDREVYGAIVAAPEGFEVLTASAASPAGEQLLAGVAAGVGARPGAGVTLTDVV